MASGIAVAVVGMLCLVGGRSRPRGALAFGLFGLVWGLQITFGNSTSFATSTASARWLYGLFLAFQIPLPYLLLAFAASQAEGERHGRWSGVRNLAAGIALLNALFVLLDSSAYLADIHVSPDNGILVFTPGPLYAPLIVLPIYAAFGLTFVALVVSLRASPTPRTRSRDKILLIGLSLFLAPLTGKYAIFYGGAIVEGAGSPTTWLYCTMFVALLGVVGWAGFTSLRDGRHTTDPAKGQTLRSVSRWMLLPGALGLVEGAINVTVSQDLFTVGLWRLAAVGVIAVGLAQWRYYDFRQRATRWAANAGGAVVATAGGAAVFGAGTLVSETPTLPVLAALTVLGVSILPSIRLTRRLFGVPSGEPARTDDDAVYGQRIDAYRAALEASFARESLEEDAEFLAALRERFGISEAEDRVLRHYAKSSVVVARDRKAHEAFERLRLLGEGGGGRTWLARDRQRDRLVVLKEPLQQWQQDPQTREAVLREARLAAKVRHPNVVAVEEVVEGKGSPIIVMEYLEGGSLSDHLRAKGTLPWREAVPLVVDVLRGVEAVHGAGIVHRDIKPSNILLNGEGVPKVADFGIALPTLSTRTVLDVGSTARAGTLFYMAPEVRAGLSQGDRRADVYACAAVLHECLYGAPPGAHAPVILRSDVPPALTALLARALAERPNERVATARVFAEELAKVLR
jgi:hypothetical protein